MLAVALALIAEKKQLPSPTMGLNFAPPKWNFVPNLEFLFQVSVLDSQFSRYVRSAGVMNG